MPIDPPKSDSDFLAKLALDTLNSMQTVAKAAYGVEPMPASKEVRILECWMCQGFGRCEDGSRCFNCAGKGRVATDPDYEI